MAMPFDAMLKDLIDAHVGEWSAFLANRIGLPTGPAESLDTDLATNLRADRLLKVAAQPPYALHLELEATHQADYANKLLRYNVLARYVTEQKVYSVVMLLRPKANMTELTGFTEWGHPSQIGYLAMRYAVIRVWEEPIAAFLDHPGLIPLALLTNQAATNLEASFQQVVESSRACTQNSQEFANLLHSSYILGGLRYANRRLLELFSELSMKLEESSTYQALMKKGLEKGIEQGRRAEAHESILALGPLRLGEPDASTVQAIEAIQDLPRLKRMQKALFFASSWQDILQIS